MFLIPNREPLDPVDWVSDECKEYWNDALQHLGTDLEEHLRCFLSEFGSILSSSTGFRVRVVVDTNVALSETLRLMRGKSPFLSKLAKSPFLEVVAPIEMEYELLEKIGEKFQDPDDRDKATEIAQSVLNDVSVVTGFQIDSMVRAQALMGVRDPDDVVFVQIAIDYSTHGVVSKDRHFMNLGEIKRWELGEVGRVITEMNRGALTLWVAARGLPIAALVLIKFGMMIVSLGFRAIQQLVSAGVNLVGTAIETVIAAARANPLLALGAVVGIALVSFFWCRGNHLD